MTEKKSYVSPLVKTVVFKVENGYNNSCYTTGNRYESNLMSFEVGGNNGSSNLETYNTFGSTIFN